MAPWLAIPALRDVYTRGSGCIGRAQERADLLLNLRIIQQTPEHLFDNVALLNRLDLVFKRSVIHRAIIPEVRQASAPSP
jgi:hypothetical protein